MNTDNKDSKDLQSKPSKTSKNESDANIIRHETIPGEKGKTSNRNHPDGKSSLSTTDEDLN